MAKRAKSPKEGNAAEASRAESVSKVLFDELIDAELKLSRDAQGEFGDLRALARDAKKRSEWRSRRHAWGDSHGNLTKLLCATDEQFSRYLAKVKAVVTADADDFFGEGFSDALAEDGPTIVDDDYARKLLLMPATLSFVRAKLALSTSPLPKGWADAVSRVYGLE